MARSTIRHIAIVTKNPIKLADFYQAAFGMEIRAKITTKEGHEYAFVTDGHITMALLQSTLIHDMPPGINHIGFKVENMEETIKTLMALGCERPLERPSDRPYAELRTADIDGNLIDLSEAGYERSKAQGVTVTEEHVPAE